MAQTRPEESFFKKFEQDDEQNFNLLFHPINHLANSNKLFKEQREYNLDDLLINFLVENNYLRTKKLNKKTTYELNFPEKPFEVKGIFVGCYSFLKQFKTEKNAKILILREYVIKFLENYVKSAYELIVLGKDDKERIEIMHSILTLTMFIHNYCLFQTKSDHGIVLSKCFQGENICNYYRILSCTYVSIEEFDKAEICAQRFKKLTKDAFSENPKVEVVDKNSTDWQIVNMSNYYGIMSEIAYQRKNEILAKKYAFKLLEIENIASEDGLQVAYNSVQLYQTNMYDNLRKNQLEEALFWAKCGKQAAAFNETNFMKVKLGIMPVNDASLINLHIKKNKLSKEIFISLINNLKPKVFNSKIDSIKAIFSQVKMIENDFEIGEKFAIHIRFKNADYLSVLTRILRSYGYVCAYHAEKSVISIHNIMHVNVAETLPEALKRWKNKVLKQQALTSSTSEIISQLRQMTITEKSEPTSTADNKKTNNVSSTQSPSSSSSSNSSYSAPKNTAAKYSPSSSSSTSSEPQPKASDNYIRWSKQYPFYNSNRRMNPNPEKSNKNRVYTVNGRTVNRQYLFINPELTEYVSQLNPDAMTNLLKMCERGKGISKSKGKKGILIKGKNAKIKDCTKKYRFYGSVVDEVQTPDGQTHQLLQINSYTNNKKEKKPWVAPSSLGKKS